MIDFINVLVSRTSGKQKKTEKTKTYVKQQGRTYYFCVDSSTVLVVKNIFDIVKTGCIIASTLISKVKQMKNRLEDLNDHLFCALERLNDESLSDSELKREVERSKAMAMVSKEIVAVHSLALDVVRTKADLPPIVRVPSCLEFSQNQ